MAFPKLFIPRKNYLRGFDGKPLPPTSFEDELANYLAIERWANSLTAPSSFAPRSDLRIVSASNSSAVAKAGSDYVCTGTGDDTTIQTAINDIKSQSDPWGTVILHPGKYTFGTTGIDGNNTVSVRASGWSVEGNGWTINIPGNATKCFHNVPFIWGLDFLTTSFVALTAMTEAVCVCQRIENCRFDFQVAGFTAGVGICVTTAGEVLGCVFNLFRNATQGLTGVSFGGPDGPQAIYALVRGNFFDGGLGIDAVVGVAPSAQTVVNNYFQVCTRGAIALDNPTGALIEGNHIRFGTSSTTDGIIVNSGTRNTIRGNIIKRDTGAMRNGINVVAGTNNIVVNNDLNLSGSTNSFIDTGTGTIKNYDGSANNWNLL